MGERHTGGSRQQHDSDLKTEDLKWRDKVWIIGTGGKAHEGVIAGKGTRPKTIRVPKNNRQKTSWWRVEFPGENYSKVYANWELFPNQKAAKNSLKL